MQDAIVGLGRTSLVYGSGQVLLRIINILLLPLFTAYLSPADYGIVSVLTLATLFLGPIFALSVPSAIGLIYYDDEDLGRRARIITTSVLLLTLTGTVLIAIGSLSARWLVALLFPGMDAAQTLSLLLVISIATTAIANVAQPLLFQLQLEQRARTFVILTVVTTIVTIATSVGFVVGLRAGVVGFVTAGLIGQATGLALALAATRRREPSRFDVRIARRLLGLGIPLVPSFLFLFVMFQANRYVIQLQHGLDAVGVYTIGFNLGYTLNLVVAGFQNAWVPFFLSYSSRQDEARRLFGRITTYYVLAVGSLTLLYFMAARPGVLILTRPAFHDAYLVVGAAATSQFLVGIFSLLLAGVYFVKDVRSVPIIQGIAAAVGLGLNVVLISQLGIAGAGVALVASTFLMVALLYALNVWRHYLAVEYDWSRLLPFGVTFALLAVAFSWPRELPLVDEIALSVAGAVVVFVIGLRLLSPTERRWLGQTAVALLQRRRLEPSASDD